MMYKHSGVWDNLKAGIQSLLGLRPTDARAESHFKSKKPDWNKFDSAVESPGFRKAVLADPRSDKKLRQFTTMQGKIKGFDGDRTKVLSSKGDKSYSVQYHKDIGRFSCTCPDFKYKRTFDKGGECKHIKQVKGSGGLKTSTIQSFGNEYATLLDRDPDYAWAADSAATRQLRKERGEGLPLDEREGRLRTTEDEKVHEAMHEGGDDHEGIPREQQTWKQDSIREC